MKKSCKPKNTATVCMECGEYRYDNVAPFKRKHVGPFKEFDVNTLYRYLREDMAVDGRFDVARYQEDNP